MDTIGLQYEVLYEQASAGQKGMMAQGHIHVDKGITESINIVREFLLANWKVLIRENPGAMRFPYLVPGASYQDLWDWDSFFVACALPEDSWEYGKGCVINLTDGNMSMSGKPAKKVSLDGSYDYFSHPYPLQAQFAYIMASRLKDFSWVEPLWDRLVNGVCWFEREATDRGGYFVWTHFYGNGIDNNPSIYGRPPYSSAGIDLACWHYREYKAMEKLSRILNRGEASMYSQKAARLKEMIQTRYWDRIDKFFYSIDCLTDYSQATAQRVNWVTHLKFRNFASLFPLWAHVATREQADLICKKVLCPQEYLSVCGIRSHSAVDPVYNNVPMMGPSNWQGPVWGLTTFLTGYGLAGYGYKEEALEVCSRMIRTFAADITQNGCLHEYYDGDTGQPLFQPGYLSWNMLTLRVMEDINSGTDSTTLDLLD